MLAAHHRRTRLCDAMAGAGLDALLLYGNAWQVDYLRYGSAFGIVEGQALALFGSGGQGDAVSRQSA